MKRAGIQRRPADNHLGAVAWEQLRLLLFTRSGELCEVRSSRCLAAPDGWLGRPGLLVSVHHRKPQGMGGTSRVDVHELHHLLVVCGDGTRGCHGWVESERAEARRRGLLVEQAVDAAGVPVELSSGRLVLLDPVGVFYRHAGWRLH